MKIIAPSSRCSVIFANKYSTSALILTYKPKQLGVSLLLGIQLSNGYQYC